MKNKISIIKCTILIILAIFLINHTSYSQPEATVQFIIGYSHALPDLKGDFGPTFNTWTGNGNPDTNTFYMKSGLNYGILIKAPIKLRKPINIVGGIVYNVFNNTIYYNDSSGQGDYDLTQSILGISIGAEYNFHDKKSKFNPFIGAELLLSIFGGKLTINLPGGLTEYTMNTTVRMGFQAGAGFDYAFHNNLGLTIGGKYVFANVVGKSYSEDFGSKYHLNDGAHTTNGADYPAKNVTFLQFYGGLSYYFGR